MAHGNMIYDPDEIVRLYVEERLSLRMIADHGGARFGLPRRLCEGLVARPPRVRA